MKLTIALALGFASIASAELPASFVRAIHQVESSGRLGAIKGDNGLALGPLQIHRAYWQDSGIAGDYSQCADLEYSKRVMAAYLKRYAPKAVKANDFQTMARIHNGGPLGYKTKATLPYWNKAKKNLQK